MLVGTMYSPQYDVALFLFPIPFVVFALLFSLPPISSRNSDPGSHSPPPPWGSCLAFLSR